MKRITLYLILALAPVVLVAFRPMGGMAVVAELKAAISFDRTSQQLGQIKQSKPVQVKFECKNTGNDALIISSAKGSCGCTQVQYPTDPIAPGATATVQGTFDAAKVGVFSKSITVFSNAGADPTVLSFSGEVVQ